MRSLMATIGRDNLTLIEPLRLELGLGRRGAVTSKNSLRIENARDTTARFASV